VQSAGEVVLRDEIWACNDVTMTTTDRHHTSNRDDTATWEMGEAAERREVN
jgi:hypothetical protein